MIDEVEWTCPDCGEENKSMVYSKKYTARCKHCFCTVSIVFEGPKIHRVLGGREQENVDTT